MQCRLRIALSPLVYRPLLVLKYYERIFLEQQSEFMRSEPGTIRSTVFMIYRAIPFLTELQIILDWILVRTSLTLWVIAKFILIILSHFDHNLKVLIVILSLVSL
jgi:hypothetical protein